MIAKLLDIDSVSGKRKDIALFAHLDKVVLSEEGHIHIDRLQKGWSWRIPLPGRTSVGIVISPDELSKYGSKSREQYDTLICSEPTLSKFAGSAKRLTPVMKFSNYQLTSTKMFGSNWVMVGDAAGFIDPIFSSGLLLALRGAHQLACEITKKKVKFERYQRIVKVQLHSWQQVVDYFYDGRLFSLVRMGKSNSSRLPGKFLAPLMERQIGKILVGIAPSNSYGQALLNVILQHYLRDHGRWRLRIE